MKDDYVPIRLKTIKPEESLGFSVFLELPKKLIKYTYAGDELESDRYHRLIQKKVKKVYIHAEDEPHYQEYLDKKLDAAINDKNVSAQERATLVTEISNDAMENMMNSEDKAEAYEQLKNNGNSMSDVVNKNPEVLKALFDTKDDDDIIFKSAVNTSSLTVRVAKLLAFAPGLLEAIGTASLLRDLSIPNMGDRAQELFIMPYDDFSEEDWALYQEHPIKSLDFIDGLENVNPEVKNIVKFHEENCLGTGFPGKVSQMTMQCEITAMCSYFDRNVTVLGMTPQDALTKLKESKGLFNTSYVKKLEEVLVQSELI